MDENEESIDNYIIYIFIGNGEETKLSSSFILWIWIGYALTETLQFSIKGE